MNQAVKATCEICTTRYALLESNMCGRCAAMEAEYRNEEASEAWTAAGERQAAALYEARHDGGHLLAIWPTDMGY